MIALLLSTIIFFFTVRVVKRNYIEATTVNLKKIALAVAPYTTLLYEKRNYQELDTFMKNTGSSLDTRITVIDQLGFVLADSKEKPQLMENHLERSEVRDALSGKTGEGFHFSKTLKKNMFYVAIPVYKNGAILYVLRVSVFSKNIDNLLGNIRQKILIAVFIILVLSLIAAFALSKKLSDPIEELSRAAHEIASGNFDVKICIKNNDELQELTDSFNYMIDRIRKLFSEIGSQKEELNAIITRLKNMEKFKKDFVTNVSHELRTPLTVIKGFTETIECDCSEENRRYASIINRHCDRLISIVQDLLTLSELEEKNIEIKIEEVNVKDLLENTAKIFKQKIADKKLELTLQIETSAETFRANAFKLEQVLINLIDNAVKYTEKGWILVAVKRDNSNIVIKVQDTGIGILKDNIPRLFERFYVVDKNRSRSLGGTGLGLSIVKHIVLLHKGTITVESQPGQGTKFTVTLPQ